MPYSFDWLALSGSSASTFVDMEAGWQSDHVFDSHVTGYLLSCMYSQCSKYESTQWVSYGHFFHLECYFDHHISAAFLG